MAEMGLAEMLEECTERCRKMDAPLPVRFRLLPMTCAASALNLLRS